MTTEIKVYSWGCKGCGKHYGHVKGCWAKSEAAKQAAQTRKENAARCRKCWGQGHQREYNAVGKCYVRMTCPECDGSGVRKDTPANPFKVGDILTGSWGYDQTNVEFYQVIAATKASVTIQKVSGFRSMDNGHQTRVYPAKDQLHGEKMRKIVSPDGYVKLYDWGVYLRKWDGGGRYGTSSGAGH
jgi:hypothetical protein